MNEICQNCSSIIDHAEVVDDNIGLIQDIDNGVISEPTDLQAAIYQGIYCQKCITNFLT